MNEPTVYEEALSATLQGWLNNEIKKYDEVLREKMIQQVWFKAKGLSGKNPMISLAVVEDIINEAKVEENNQ